MRLGGLELIVILVIIVLVFGGTLIPKLLKNTSSSLKTFKKEMKDLKEEDSKDGIEEVKPEEADKD